jgi:hypothetical protein
MDKQLFLIVGLALVVVVAVLVVEWYRKQQRAKQLRAIAAQQGYAYAEDGTGLVGSLGWTGLFSHGVHSGQASNALRAEADGAAVTALDYRYTTGVAKNQRTVRQTVLILDSERLDLPAFTLRPEGLGQKLGGAMGQQDIDFQEQLAFSSAYVLQGSDEAQIRALFDAEKLAFFAERRGLSVEGDGHRLVYYRDHKLVSPKALQSFFEEGRAVLSLMAGE